MVKNTGNTPLTMISVIIPIYNAAKTLNICMESILGQTYKDIEVICVDDESTDDSLAMCKKYQSKDSRVKIVQKKNGGVASARNEGIKVAKGKYVTFIDQDDWLEKNAYEEMLTLATAKDADIVVCNYSKDTNGVVQKMESRQMVPEEINSGSELIKYAFQREEYRGFAAFVWNKLFKRELLEQNQINFAPDLKRGDDVLFYSQVAAVSQKAVYINKCFYHYIQREDSITHTRTGSNIERLSNILTGYERAIEVLENAKITKESIDYMKCFYVFHASVLYELAREEELPMEQKRFGQAMQKYIVEYKNQNKGDKERLERIDRLICCAKTMED